MSKKIANPIKAAGFWTQEDEEEKEAFPRTLHTPPHTNRMPNFGTGIGTRWNSATTKIWIPCPSLASQLVPKSSNYSRIRPYLDYLHLARALRKRIKPAWLKVQKLGNPEAGAVEPNAPYVDKAFESKWERPKWKNNTKSESQSSTVSNIFYPIKTGLSPCRLIVILIEG